MSRPGGEASMPRVSILMTIYNAAPYLRESIDSLLAQSFADWELVVIENGSTDASPNILASYSDNRIRAHVFSKNIGRTPALQYAFERSRGEFIAVLDADDVSSPERLERQVGLLDACPEVVLVGAWVQYIDEESKVFAAWRPPVDSEQLHDCLGWVNPMVHSAVMFRSDAANAVGGYSGRFIYAQDFGLILELAQRGRLAIIDDYLCKFRVLRKGMTGSSAYRIVSAREGMELFLYARRYLPLSAVARRKNRRAVAVCEIKIGMAELMGASIFSGIFSIMKGVFHDPITLFDNAKVNKLLHRKQALAFLDY